MAAEWILQCYAYDPKKLDAFVGGKKVVRVPRELLGDDRVEVPLADAISEIANRKLKRDHAMAYRVALEAIMNVIGKRVHPRVTTYALKPDVGRVATRLGLKMIGRAWNNSVITFPSPALAKKIDWPMAASLDAKSTVISAAESKSVSLVRSSLDARVVAFMPKDPDFATDVADVIVALVKATKKAALAKSAMMILVDGEQ